MLSLTPYKITSSHSRKPRDQTAAAFGHHLTPQYYQWDVPFGVLTSVLPLYLNYFSFLASIKLFFMQRDHVRY